jgi:NADPH2:quinone reductase
MKAWRAHQFGGPDVLQLDDVPIPEPGPGHVRVKCSTITLNFNDIDIIHGTYPDVMPPLPFIPGMENLGVVDACGQGAESWMGKRVVTVPADAYGGYADYCIGPTAMTFEMPDDMSDADASAFFMPFHLAWLGLEHRARVQPGETVLVHAAAGGNGSAAVQVAVQLGARVIATAGSPEKVAFCKELGADVAINYRSEDIYEAVMAATGGRGVDVAWDGVGGDVMRETFRCMAMNGRHLIFGFASGIAGEDEGISPRPMIFGNFSMLGMLVAYVDDPAAVRAMTGANFVGYDEAKRAHESLLERVKQGKLRPIVGMEASLEELPSALAAMERRETVGRVVITVGS